MSVQALISVLLPVYIAKMNEVRHESPRICILFFGQPGHGRIEGAADHDILISDAKLRGQSYAIHGS